MSTRTDSPMIVSPTISSITIPVMSPMNQPTQPSDNKLTIYSHSGHMIRRFSPGTKVITLPKAAEINSIVVIDVDGIVIPFSYIPESTMGIALTNRNTGEKIEASVVKGSKTVNGKILSLDSYNVTLTSGGQISTIRKYDMISANIPDDETRPRIILGRTNKPFTVSYLLSNVGWSCVGTALIDKTNSIMYLRLAGNIVNNTENDIAADTILVSGEVYQGRGTQPVYAEAVQSRMLQSAPISSKQVSTSMLEDYTKYEVGPRIVHDKDIAELGTFNFPVIKIYVHRTDDSGIVKFGYRFIAPGFVPACSVNVYNMNQDKSIDSYLGSNDIEESQKNDEIDLMLGQSTLLQCESLVVISDVVVSDETTAKQYNLPLETFSKSYKKSDDREWHVVTEDLTVDITNHNTNTVSMILKHHIGNRLLIDTRCQQYKDRKNGFIEWYFQIAPISNNIPRKDKFTCQIITAGFY